MSTILDFVLFAIAVALILVAARSALTVTQVGSPGRTPSHAVAVERQLPFGSRQL